MMAHGSEDYAGARVLVTGATGFIGSHLCRRLRSCGAEVHGVGRSRPIAAQPGVQWWAADLAQAGSATGLLAKVRPDVVFHLASHVAGSRDKALVLPTFRNNLATTVHLLDAVADIACQRVVLAGSMEVAGPDGTDPVPASPYAAAKWAAAGYARMYHALYGLPMVTARLFMTYGPGQRDLQKLVPYVIGSLLRGESPQLTSGTREVDWIYVADVVDGLMALGRAPGVDGLSVDIGSGELVPVADVVKLLAECLGTDVELGLGQIEDRPMEQVSKADVGTTETLLGWRASTGLQEGLSRTVAYYRDEATGLDAHT